MAKIDFYLKACLNSGASDLHFSSGEVARLRVDGDLQVITGNPVDEEKLSEMMLELISEADKEKLFSERNLDKSVSVAGIGTFRLNIFFTRKGMSAVLRTIPVEIPKLEEMGLPPVIRELCALEKGLVLVTGPTGSGKSTTLAAMVNHINDSQKSHILTIEDPVEFVHSSKLSLVNQREIGGSCKSFADALKYALREDPDVILIGEMRDLETISLALKAAETGHLVFGTLHTRGAGPSVDRIIDSFPPNQQAMIRAMLADALKAVVSQTLFKRASGKGRVAAFEIMVVNHAISNLIREGKTFQIATSIQVGKKDGMIALEQSMLDLVAKQMVKPEEVAPYMENPGLLETLVRNMSKGSKVPGKPGTRGSEAVSTEPVSVPKPSMSSELPNRPAAAPVKLPSAPPKLPTVSGSPPALKNNLPPLPIKKADEPPIKPVNEESQPSFQDNFKSLFDEDGDEDLLSEMEIVADEKKKTG